MKVKPREIHLHDSFPSVFPIAVFLKVWRNVTKSYTSGNSTGRLPEIFTQHRFAPGNLSVSCTWDEYTTDAVDDIRSLRN